ncbi:hypothetical protein C5F59_003280 [Streptomyces sp. QL37]|uniref:hypothetical protein n=1 Tax=Streptomyces sp. QL37 TaxID=2093747 RepID=UPI000CF2040B|nr:hypothetical protein [Streptomyces sp. QL37]PPQ55827.1 hypothetical protein C5F59_03320 [Streptomyces sp. QL37]
MAENTFVSPEPDEPQNPEFGGTSPDPTSPASVPTLRPGDLHIQQAGVAAGYVRELNVQQELRKRDVLEGVARDRQEIFEQPFVLSGRWKEAWDQAVDGETHLLRPRILLVVAPRSFGSTTFALQLLARHTEADTTLVKLDADWSAPSRGRLPLGRHHAYQVDLKDTRTDRLSADFLDSLTRHAENLASARSFLVITVAKELWPGHYLSPRGDVKVVHLDEPPEVELVVKEHLEYHGHPQLLSHLQSLDEAVVSLRGLNAVEAVRAVLTAMAVWEEYHGGHPHLSVAGVRAGGQERSASFAERLTAALSDWREKLDGLFGETTATYDGLTSSLTLEDRCLLLALAVRQSAPMTEVAATAGSLRSLLAVPNSNTTAAEALAQSVFAGRGLRRRIHDVGAHVNTHDSVVFDQPAYGRAVLAYVWDNYAVMRAPLLTWLTQPDDGPVSAQPTVDALTGLVLRHGTADHLDTLGSIACDKNPELLGAVLLRAVGDEHVGRAAWATLYRWAGQHQYTRTVVDTCRSVLMEETSGPSAAKMALVRLRRVARKEEDPATRLRVLAVMKELVTRPARTAMLVTEVAAWQAAKVSARSGSLAFLALMEKEHSKVPWLMSEEAVGIDVDRALRDLLGDAATAQEVIPQLTQWVGSYATDAVGYELLRDRLVHILRGNGMFQAYWSFMRALAEAPVTVEGVDVAEDFHQHLVDPRLHSVFGPGTGSA